MPPVREQAFKPVRLPDCTRRSKGTAVESRDFPMYAVTQRPAAMYHSWGSMNAWLRQLHGVTFSI